MKKLCQGKKKKIQDETFPLKNRCIFLINCHIFIFLEKINKFKYSSLSKVHTVRRYSWMHQNLASKIQKVLIERQFWQLTDIQSVLMINCTQIVKRSLCTSSNSSCTAILMRFVHTFYNLKSSFGESRNLQFFLLY